jgi:hypothetical protein
LLEDKTLWEIYDIGCTNNFELPIIKSSAKPLYDDYEISRYPKFVKNTVNKTPDYGKWKGLELTATDINYEKPKSINCYDKLINNDERDIRSETELNMKYSDVISSVIDQ